MTLSRDQIEADIIQQVGNATEEALLLHAPVNWPNERLDEIEEEVLAHTRLVLDSLSASELQSEGALAAHIDQAVAETRRLIRSGFRRPA